MYVSPVRTERYVFPMQGDLGRRIAPGWITWDDALEIYRYYYALFGGQQSLTRIGERHGFGPNEYEFLRREFVVRGTRPLPSPERIREIAGETYAPRRE